MVTSVTKGRAQKLHQKCKIVETYRHDHSLESSWRALSAGTISFLIQPFFGGKYIFWIFLKKNLLKSKKNHLRFHFYFWWCWKAEGGSFRYSVHYLIHHFATRGGGKKQNHKKCHYSLINGQISGHVHVSII
jgi:hypothetical protein